MLLLFRSYSGFADDKIKGKMIEELAQDLSNDSKGFDDRVFYTASYDGPYAFRDRHNEIWVVPK